MNAIKSAAVWVAYIINSIFGRDASTKFAQAALAILKSDFGKIVLTIVTTLGTSDLTNQQKRDAAFSQIKDAAIAGGLDVKDSIINLLIELAVAQLKANFGEQA